MNISTEPIRNTKDIKKLLTYLKKQKERNYVLAVIQLNTARRVSDIRELKVSSFYYEDRKFRKYVVLKEQKTNKNQHIAINSAVKRVLSSYIKNNYLTYNDYLFPGKFGQKQPISSTQIHRIYQKASQELNLECFNSHSLRKTWGYAAYKKTKDIALIMQIYGHTSVADTFRYIGLEQDSKDKAYKELNFNLEIL